MKQKRSILIINDDPSDSQFIQKSLEQAGSMNYTVQITDTLAKGISKIKNNIDVVLLDLNLPDSNGLDTLIKIQQVLVITIIVLSDAGNIMLANQCIQNGAQDYLIKGTFDAIILIRSIDYSIERFQINQKLIANEKTLETLIKNNADSILIIDKEGIILYANKQAEIIFGKTNEKLIGSFFGNIDLLIDQPVDILGANKNVIYAEAKSKEILWKDKNVYLTTLRDISSHIHLQQNLQDSKNEIIRQRDTAQKYLNIAGVIILILDRKGKIMLINKKGCEILGYKEEDILSKNWFNHFIPVDNKNELINIHTENMAKTEKFTEYYENFVITKHNTIKQIAWHNSLYKEDGKIIGIISSGEDVTEQKKALESIEYLATFPELNPNPIVEIDSHFTITYMNPYAKKYFPDLINLKEKHSWLGGLIDIIKSPQKDGLTIKHREVLIGDKWYQQAIDYVKKKNSYRIYGTDITERKQREERELIVKDVLYILNKTNDVEYAIQNILEIIQKVTHIESIAIRLREGEDFPYYKTSGFTKDFIKSEKYLCARDMDGTILYDCNNIPFLECMCGNVISGRTDPSKPFYTASGSFWSNNTAKLLSSKTDADQMTRMRNRYKKSGYKSVALIPLRTGDEIIGLLQLNDHRSECFTLDMIHFFEGLGSSIGIALARKWSQEALQTSEEKFRSTMENSADAIFIADPSGKYIYTNKAVTDMLGFTQEEMLTKRITDLAPANRIDEYLKTFIDVLKKGKIFAEIELRKKNGTFVTADLNAVVLPDGMIYGSCRNISARKKAERKLKESEIRYRRLFEAAQDGILILDAQTGMILDVNPYLCELLGFSLNQFQGKAIWEIGFFKDIIANKGNFKELQKKKYIRYEDLPLETADGRTIAVEFVSNVYQMGDEEVVQCNIRDITERRKAEEEIKLKNIILTTQQDASLDGILAVDSMGKILSCNKRFIEIWGVPDVAINSNSDKIVLQAVLSKITDPESFIAKVDYLYEHHKEMSFDEIHLIDSRIIDRYSAPMNGENGQYYGRIWYFRDITERKKTENFLIESEKRNEIAMLSAGVAHEFNNILAIIKSTVQLLIMGQSMEDIKLSDHVSEELKSIDRQTNRGADIVSNLTLLSRPGQVDNEEVYIEDIISDVLKLQKKQFELENIIVTRDFQKTKRISVNSGQMQQIFLNLTINARHALKAKNGGKITISTFYSSHDVIIKFSDTGTGIKDEIKDKIFSPFFTTKGAHAQDDLGTKGTGLGLSIINSIIKEYKGNIQVESEEGEGASFIITLPLTQKVVKETLGGKAHSNVLNIHSKDINILIVDDELMIGRNLEKLLNILGFHHINVFSNPEDVIQTIRERHFDIYFIDLLMPVIKGNDLYQEIRKEEKNKDAKIIIMSGLYNAEVKKTLLSCPGCFFLKKPFNSEHIINLLNQEMVS